MYDQYGHWHDVYWYHDSWHHMGGLFIVIIMLLVVFGVMYLVQSSSKSSTGGSNQQGTAMDTLKKRYASGEINAEEFEQKKRDLER